MGRLEEYLEQRLKLRGLRVTAERRAILSHAVEHFDHFFASDLIASLRRHGCPVSRATVYRALSDFVDVGLLRRHELGDRRTFYEPTFGREHHEHMVCVRCGRILEFVQEEIERLQDEVCRAHRFRPLSHNLQIQGICGDCREVTASHG